MVIDQYETLGYFLPWRGRLLVEMAADAYHSSTQISQVRPTQRPQLYDSPRPLAPTYVPKELPPPGTKDRHIEHTIPEKPNSRLQMYRLAH